MNHPTPDFRITLDGKDLTTVIEPRLISLSLSESRQDEADMLDLTLDDHDGKLAIPKRGAVLAVAIGWAGSELIDKGQYTVDEVEHAGAPDTITVRARSASMTKGLGERQEKSWHDVSIGGIVNTIAAKHGLKPTVSDKLAATKIAHIDQTHESDLSFLTRLAKRYDAVMTVKEGRLLFMPIGKGVTVSGQALKELTLSRLSGDQHRYHIAERESYAGVRAYWHSTKKNKRESVIVGGENNRNLKVLPEVYPTEAEATAAATAELARVERSQATMDYNLALGRPEIFPELPVTVTGFHPQIDETPWLVKRVRHSISDSGFTSSVELEMRDDPTTGRHSSHF